MNLQEKERKTNNSPRKNETIRKIVYKTMQKQMKVLCVSSLLIETI